MTASDGLGFTSHDANLADLAVNGGTIAVSGTIDNYATAQVKQTGGAGTLTQNGTLYTLNLGNVEQYGSVLLANLGVLNAASGTADNLNVTFAASGSSQFVNTGLTPFSFINAGSAETAQGIALNTGTVGVFSETVVVTPTGTNASGYSGTLAPETIAVVGTVNTYAVPILSTGTVNLGAVRVGGSLAAGIVVVSDGPVANPNQESLLYNVSGPSGVTINNGTGTVASGGSAAVGFGLNTATAANYTGTQATVQLTSTGAGTDGLPNTGLV